MYKEYHEQLLRLKAMRIAFADLLEQKENLFLKTQPGAIRYDKDPVMGGKMPGNNFDQYLIACEESGLDAKYAEAKKLLGERAAVLEEIKGELMCSLDVLDRVYVRRYLWHWRVNRIAADTGYSEPRIYYFLREIRRELKTI